jgi:hypothetical protein
MATPLAVFGQLLANPVVGAAAANVIDQVIGIVIRRNQGEITEEQALRALQTASSSVAAAFDGWHAAKRAGERT